MSSVSEWMFEKNILITGSTGFLGKCLLEKVLRLKHFHNIYLLLRPKSGKGVKKRLNELLDEKCFDFVRHNCPEQFQKIVVVCGDVTYDEMGLNPIERQLLVENVEIVVNCAATIRFDEPLRRAIQLNVLSVQRLLQLVQRFHKIQALVHVSTAYCTRDKSDVREEVFTEISSVQKFLDSIQWMDDHILDSISPHLYCGRPSSYHFSKSLSEQLLKEQKQDIPLAIVRPSIISAAIKEPSVGWIDNYNGLTGYLVATGKGILRSLYCKPDLLCDVIPVDIVVNTCLVAAHSVATTRPESPLVVNCVSGALNGVTWRQINKITKPLLLKNPSIELFRPPSVALHSSRSIHLLHKLIEHTIPAFIVDMLFRACGLTPILGQVYQKVNRSMAALEYFTCNEWKYKCENFKQLCESLSLDESQVYSCDVTNIDWNQYFSDFILGIRKFLLKESEESLPRARNQLKKYAWRTKISF